MGWLIAVVIILLVAIVTVLIVGLSQQTREKIIEVVGEQDNVDFTDDDLAVIEWCSQKDVGKFSIIKLILSAVGNKSNVVTIASKQFSVLSCIRVFSFDLAEHMTLGGFLAGIFEQELNWFPTEDIVRQYDRASSDDIPSFAVPDSDGREWYFSAPRKEIEAMIIAVLNARNIKHTIDDGRLVLHIQDEEVPVPAPIHDQPLDADDDKGEEDSGAKNQRDEDAFNERLTNCRKALEGASDQDFRMLCVDIEDDLLSQSPESQGLMPLVDAGQGYVHRFSLGQCAQLLLDECQRRGVQNSEFAVNLKGQLQAATERALTESRDELVPDEELHTDVKKNRPTGRGKNTTGRPAGKTARRKKSK